MDPGPDVKLSLGRLPSLGFYICKIKVVKINKGTRYKEKKGRKRGWKAGRKHVSWLAFVGQLPWDNNH